MSYSVEGARRGLILLVKYLKKVHGSQVVHEINRILGSEHGIKMLNAGTRAIKLDHFYPLLEFAGVEPYQFQKFISVDSYGYLPLYLYEIELLSTAQMRSLEDQIRKRRREPTKRLPSMPVSDLSEKRFGMSAKEIGDVCWATISHSEDPEDLYHAWTQLSITARGQAKYSRAASCARRALEYAQTPRQRGKLLQTVCYLAQHIFDLKPARELVLQARSEHVEAGDCEAIAQTWIDEAQILWTDGMFKPALTAAQMAEDSLPDTALMHRAGLQQIAGRAAIRLRNVDRAYEAHRAFCQLIEDHQVLDNPTFRSHCDYLLAEIYIEEERFLEAARVFRTLHADLGQSLHVMDRVLIALNLMSCEMYLGKYEEVVPLVNQTSAYLRSVKPKTTATRHYSAILGVLTKKRIDQDHLKELIGKVRRPPPTLRRRPG